MEWVGGYCAAACLSKAAAGLTVEVYVWFLEGMNGFLTLIMKRTFMTSRQAMMTVTSLVLMECMSSIRIRALPTHATTCIVWIGPLYAQSKTDGLLKLHKFFNFLILDYLRRDIRTGDTPISFHFYSWWSDFVICDLQSEMMNCQSSIVNGPSSIVQFKARVCVGLCVVPACWYTHTCVCARVDVRVCARLLSFPIVVCSCVLGHICVCPRASARLHALRKSSVF